MEPKRPDIEAIEARERKATDAPWCVFPWNDPGTAGCVSAGASDSGPAITEGVYEPGDLAFIAASRVDVPDLIAWTRHLETLLRDARAALEGYQFGSNDDGDEWNNDDVIAMCDRIDAALKDVPR